MPYDESVAARVRSEMFEEPGYSERKMFGGICFMIHGNMCSGVLRDELMLRLGNELAAESLDERHTRPMDFTGKPMKSMIFVEPEGFSDKPGLRYWVDKAVDFARTLPPKQRPTPDT